MGKLIPGVTVVGNLAVDRVEDAPPSPGGCPSFAGVGLAQTTLTTRIVTKCEAARRPLFQEMLDAITVDCDVLDSDTTSGFGLRYTGDDRGVHVDAIGPSWSPADLNGVTTTWVHLSPLLRSDFPLETMTVLAERGHLVSCDGQGLVRRPAVGPLVMDDDFDHSRLQDITVLKLAVEEAHALVNGEFTAASAAALGVPEILVTNGSHGCMLYADGACTHVPAAWEVTGVHATGAGDLFTTSYVVGRAEGRDPVDAAGAASTCVAEMLQARLDESVLAADRS